MNENNDLIVTEQEDLLMLEDDSCNDVTVRIPTGFGEIQRLTGGNTRMVYTVNASSTADTVIGVTSDKSNNNCWQIGRCCGNISNSTMRISVPIRDIITTSGDRKYVLRLYQENSYLAEPGIAIDLYKVDSFDSADMVLDSDNIVATVYSHEGNGHYYDFDISNTIGDLSEEYKYIAKMRLPEYICKESCENCNCHYDCTCSSGCHSTCSSGCRSTCGSGCGETCGCNCSCCDASNAVFISYCRLMITYTSRNEINSAIYTISNSAYNICAGEDGVNAGDRIGLCNIEYTLSRDEVKHMWMLRETANGTYAITSAVDPNIGLSIKPEGDTYYIVAKDIGSCAAEVPEDAQWVLFYVGRDYVIGNTLYNRFISVNDRRTNKESLVAEAYNNYSSQMWFLSYRNDLMSGTEPVLYAKPIGWIISKKSTIALPVGHATKLQTFSTEKPCSCSFSCSSSDPSVATVSCSGLVTARKVGKATITVLVNSVIVEFFVNVVDKDIAISTPVDHGIEGTTIQLSAITTSGTDNITWSSSDENTASVDAATGLVTIHRAGAFDITAESDGLSSHTVTMYGVIPDGVYRLQYSTNNCISVSEKKLFDDSPARVAGYEGASQLWHVIYNSAGEYVIRSYANPVLILAYDNNDVYVMNVPATSINCSEYKWKITQHENCTYAIDNASTHKGLEIYSTVNGYDVRCTGENLPYWSLIEDIDPVEELVIYDKTNNSYLDSDEIYMKPDEFRNLRAIYRSPDIINQSFTWTESDRDYLVVNTGGGITTENIVYTDMQNKEVFVSVYPNSNPDLRKTIYVFISNPVTSVSLQCCLTVALGNEAAIHPSIMPVNSEYSKIELDFSHTKLKIEKSKETNNRGNYYYIITALKTGTHNVTVRVYNYDGTVCEAQMTVRVKEREDVKIIKDGDFFKVHFIDDHNPNNNKIWESIGVDLSNKDNQSGHQLDKGENFENLYEWGRDMYLAK